MSDGLNGAKYLFTVLITVKYNANPLPATCMMTHCVVNDHFVVLLVQCKHLHLSAITCRPSATISISAQARTDHTYNFVRERAPFFGLVVVKQIMDRWGKAAHDPFMETNHCSFISYPWQALDNRRKLQVRTKDAKRIKNASCAQY